MNFNFKAKKGESKNKYKNKKIEVDGIIFDSKKEAKRYTELKILEKAGKIRDLKLQPKFELIPTLRIEGYKTMPITVYKADFEYMEQETGKFIVEDVKGFKTDVYKLKKKMFLYRYSGVYEFREV